MSGSLGPSKERRKSLQRQPARPSISKRSPLPCSLAQALSSFKRQALAGSSRTPIFFERARFKGITYDVARLGHSSAVGRSGAWSLPTVPDHFALLDGRALGLKRPTPFYDHIGAAHKSARWLARYEQRCCGCRRGTSRPRFIVARPQRLDHRCPAEGAPELATVKFIAKLAA